MDERHSQPRKKSSEIPAFVPPGTAEDHLARAYHAALFSLHVLGRALNRAPPAQASMFPLEFFDAEAPDYRPTPQRRAERANRKARAELVAAGLHDGIPPQDWSSAQSVYREAQQLFTFATQVAERGGLDPLAHGPAAMHAPFGDPVPRVEAARPPPFRPLPQPVRCGHLTVDFVEEVFDAAMRRDTALVSTDDTRLSARGGIAEAILRRSGVRGEMDALTAAAGGRLELRTTVATSGGGTGAARIIHATVLDVDDAGDSQAVRDEQLWFLLRDALDHAAALGVSHVVIPAALTAGDTAYSDAHVADVFTYVAMEFGAVPSSVQRVTLTLGDSAPFLFETSALSRFLDCAPALPALHDLARTRVPAARKMLWTAAKQTLPARVELLVTALESALRALAPGGATTDALIDAGIEAAKARNLGEGAAIDLELCRQIASTPIPEGDAAVTLLGDARVLHRTLAYPLFETDEPHTPLPPTFNLYAHQSVCAYEWVLVDARKYHARFPEQSVVPGPIVPARKAAGPGPTPAERVGATAGGASDATARYQLPTPISSLYAKVTAAHEPSARFGFALRLAEGIARFAAYVAVADAASCGATDAMLRGWVSTGFERAGFGKIAHVAKEATAWLRTRGDPLVPELASLWGTRWEDALGRLVERRNRFAHDEVGLGAAEATAALAAIRPDLNEVLAGVHFLSRYELGLFRSVRSTASGFRANWCPLRGIEEHGPTHDFISSGAPLEDGVVLFDATMTRGLYLEPFVRWAASATDRGERLFWLHRTENGAPRYLHPILKHEPAPLADSASADLDWGELPPPSRWPRRITFELDAASRHRIRATAPLPQLEQRYQLVGRIGEGAMGVVYEAHDRNFDRPVALKVLKPEVTRSPEAIRRLRREARVLRDLDSRHVVKVHDVVLDGEAPFIVMELVRGEDLHSVLERTGPLAPERAVAILGDVCAGLEAVHRIHVVHRDVKPSNVIIGEGDGAARLLDFGIALPMAGTRYSAALGAIGTLGYMAPEQLDGDASPASDIYAAGRTLAAMLLGKVPPLSHRTDALASVPRELREVILKATAQDPAARYPSAESLAVAARAALAPEPLRSQRAPASSKPPAARAEPPPGPPEPPRPVQGPPQRPPNAGGQSWANRTPVLRSTDPAVLRDMEAFGRLWMPVRQRAEKLGWQTSAGSRIEVYFQHNERSCASELWVSPADPTRFVFRATPRAGFEEKVFRAVSEAAGRLPYAPEVRMVARKRAAGTVQVVDVTTTYAKVLGPGSPSEAEVSERLSAFVEPLLMAIPSR